MALGDRTIIPCPPSPPRAFCQLKVRTSIFDQSISTVKIAEVASHIVNPSLDGSIQLTSGKQTPLVVPQSSAATGVTGQKQLDSTHSDSRTRRCGGRSPTSLSDITCCSIEFECYKCS